MKRATLFLLITLLINFFSVSQEIGLQLYSLRHQMEKDVPGTLEKIQSWGISNLEEGNGGTHGYSMPEYKALLSKHDLSIVSVSGSYEDFRDAPEKIIKKAKDYGAKYAVCFWIPHNDTIFTIEETRKAVNAFNKAGKKMKAEGITLAYHPHGYEFRPYGDGLLMDHMIKSAEHFDFEMDVYWFAHPGEDPLEWLRKYPEKFKLMHLKDCQKGVKGNQNGTSDVETNVVLGSGQIDIAAIIVEAKKMNIDYLFIEDESSKVMEQIPKSLNFIKSLRE
ncbi:sugar phosphate isomerase/epimerase [Allomuricauda sp. d1]|uniref:sugar phosphate isomerase/epimerase family protein n=1 Tax=Allomuricauda sp. d1 TaxID=3136725 RepID=UPI0031E36627